MIKINLNDFEDFIEFTKKQIEILKKKETEYKDTWKECPLNYLKHKFDYQRVKLDKLLNNKSISQLVIVDVKDTLLDIANYAFFLYTKITKTGV